MKVRHPAFPEVTKDVRDPARWVAQGWLLDEPPAPPKPHPFPAKSPKSSRRPRRAASAASERLE